MSLTNQEFKKLLERMLEHYKERVERYKHRLEKWDDDIELKPFLTKWMQASVKELKIDESTLIANIEGAIKATKKIPSDIADAKTLWTHAKTKQEWEQFKPVVEKAAGRYRRDLQEVAKKLELDGLKDLKELYAEIDKFHLKSGHSAKPSTQK
jgi:exonuclease VII large subunit